MENACKFHHPYNPYDIQLDLMRCVYETLSDPSKKVAILESPTGTGKTLSLICSTLTWLRNNKAEILGGTEQGIESSDDDEPDWVKETYNGSILQDKLQLLDEYEKYLDGLKQNEAKNKKIVTSIDSSNKKKRILEPSIKKSRRNNAPQIEISIEDESEFVPKPYESDNEESSAPLDKKVSLNKEVQELLVKFDTNNQKDDNVRMGRFASASQNPVKIYFSSRTHSQLNQFAEQLKLTNFPTSFPGKVDKERVKYMPLGSKKQLCINPDVTKWKTLEAINDACSEVRQSKDGCPYYKNTSEWHNSTETNLFRDNVYSDVNDIEDLVTIGKNLGVCPYYASRDFIPSSEVITLPYQYLLSESTRMHLNIDLKSSIVVIDEAHNLIDTINAIHSSEVSLSDLKKCKNGLVLYLQKFKSRLNAGNRVNLMKLNKLIDVLINFISVNYKKPGQEIDPFTILAGQNTDMLNVHKILKYIKNSQIAYKLDTYIQKLTEKPGIVEKRPTSKPLLYKISQFLECLNNLSFEGSFFFEKGQCIRYMLLEPSTAFADVVNDARCVIMAGGTMEPTSQLVRYLLPNVKDSSIVKFSCNHVIPDSHLRTFIVDEPQFEFTFEKRQQLSLIRDHLFDFYYKLSKTVPKSGGIIGFFPSYKYLQDVLKIWKDCGLLDKLQSIRKVFFEEKEGMDPLPSYSDAVTANQGAILFAIVGGKLSEGINFSGDLCRAVVMTGLPFPNVFSGELIISRNHLEDKILKNGGSKKDAANASKEFFENICMKAVNQSVGRSIRNISDYSLIYLLDRRYNFDNIKLKLSKWVRNRIQPETNSDTIMKSTKNFFDTMTNK
ncbi:ATP-dependent DNA helicase CHL1 [Nakaseomyces bracarensis]|uniref:ATP-dependent DNA helicase CHL1 n=1 Tax=Nakaseomyces bracarensis TaxID=273131 RepID=A0ABR4NXK4_9SACH